MTERTVTDEQIGKLYRRQNEIYRRVREGSLDFETAMGSLQSIIEGSLVRPWTVEDGLYYVTVTSDGKTGEQWIAHLESRGYRLSDYARHLLLSEDFVPTSGKTYRVAVLPGTLFADDDRVTSEIRADAERRGLEDPNPEVACLLRELLSDSDLKAMGLTWLAVMHEPIEDDDGGPGLLGLLRDVYGRRLCANYDGPVGRWDRDDGFAFVAPQASSGPYR